MKSRIFNHTKVNREEGFTLVELLVVITIIAILVAIALPVTRHLHREALKAHIKADLRNRVVAVQTMLVKNPKAVDTASYAGNNQAEAPIQHAFHSTVSEITSNPSESGGYLAGIGSATPAPDPVVQNRVITVTPSGKPTGTDLAWNNWAAWESLYSAYGQRNGNNFFYSFDSKTGKYTTWRGDSTGILQPSVG